MSNGLPPELLEDSIPPLARSSWALITDVSPGELGDAIANSFLKRGVNVFATSPDTREDFEYIAPPTGSLEGFLVRMRMNVTSTKSITKVVKRVHSLTDGKLDYLLNNAEYGYCMPLMDVDILQARRQFDVNVWGLLAVTQAFFPMLSAAKGTVVNHATIAGLQGYNRPFIGSYSSSKAAVSSLSGTMRVELMPFDIKVVTLFTIGTRSELIRKATGGALPISSAYLDIKSSAEAMMTDALLGQTSDDVGVVAMSVVNELLGGPSTVSIVRGFKVWMVWLALWLLPAWITDWAWMGSGGLSSLSENTSESKKGD